jgi:hypothetical protein
MRRATDIGRMQDIIGKLEDRPGAGMGIRDYEVADKAANDKRLADQKIADRLRDELATAQRRADDGSATVADLRERVARLEGEAVAAGKVEQELRAQIEWLKTPWWRRLVGKG